VYGDTQVIRSLARSLRDQGDEIRCEADRLLRRAESVPWQGLAADAMRGQARSRARALRHTAGLHDAAADALERHATEVDRVKALIAAIEHRVRSLIAAARDRLAGVAASVAAGLGIPPDPVDQLLDRFVPPPPGHLDWLRVELPGLL
jgi:hypothetical protein